MGGVRRSLASLVPEIYGWVSGVGNSVSVVAARVSRRRSAVRRRTATDTIATAPPIAAATPSAASRKLTDLLRDGMGAPAPRSLSSHGGS